MTKKQEQKKSGSLLSKRMTPLKNRRTHLLVIDVRQEMEHAKELSKWLKKNLNAKKLHGATVYDHMEMEKNRLRLRKLQNKLQSVSDSQEKHELKLVILNLQQKIAWVLLQIGKYKKAFAQYENMQGKESAESRYEGLAMSLMGMNKLEDARSIISQGLKRFPLSVPLLIAKGVFYQRSGNHAEAIAYFEQVLEQDPQNGYALFDKAVSLNALGKNKKALSILRKLNKKYQVDAKIPFLIKQIEDKAEKR